MESEQDGNQAGSICGGVTKGDAERAGRVLQQSG